MDVAVANDPETSVELAGGNDTFTAEGGAGAGAMYASAFTLSGWGAIELQPVGGIDESNTLTGRDGRDPLYGGGTVRNTITGLGGDDGVFRSWGDDVLSGGAGVDSISGDSGHDMISGGDDGDILHGDGQDDALNGDGGDDQLNGETGQDASIRDRDAREAGKLRGLKVGQFDRDGASVSRAPLGKRAVRPRPHRPPHG